MQASTTRRRTALIAICLTLASGLMGVARTASGQDGGTPPNGEAQSPIGKAKSPIDEAKSPIGEAKSGEAESPTGKSRPPATPQRPGQARITAGKVPVLDFLRYLQIASGLPVVYPSNDSGFHHDIQIHILEDSVLTIPLAKALLEAHGYQIVSKVLANGDQVLGVQHESSSPVFGKAVTPIYIDRRITADGSAASPGTGSLDPGALSAATVQTLLRRLQQSAGTPVLGSDQVVQNGPDSAPPTVLLPGDDPLEDELLLGLLAAVGIECEPMILSNGSEVLLLSGHAQSGSREQVVLVRLQHVTPQAALAHVRAKLQANFVTGEEGEIGSFRYRAFVQQRALILKGNEQTVRTLYRLLQQADAGSAESAGASKDVPDETSAPAEAPNN
ncbi:MAG: hypothetical protein AAF581_01700 [Planctomycetota bacterium]